MHNHSPHIAAAATRALAGVCALMAGSDPIPADDSLVLVGAGAALDSMAFVNFVVLLEEELEQELGRRIAVTEILNTFNDTDGSPLTFGHVVAALSERLE